MHTSACLSKLHYEKGESVPPCHPSLSPSLFCCLHLLLYASSVVYRYAFYIFTVPHNVLLLPSFRLLPYLCRPFASHTAHYLRMAHTYNTEKGREGSGERKGQANRQTDGRTDERERHTTAAMGDERENRERECTLIDEHSAVLCNAVVYICVVSLALSCLPLLVF